MALTMWHSVTRAIQITGFISGPTLSWFHSIGSFVADVWTCISHLKFSAATYRSIYEGKTILSEPGSSVSIVSVYGLDDWAIEIRSPAEAKGFFL
jgi:hypothetical protein